MKEEDFLFRKENILSFSNSMMTRSGISLQDRQSLVTLIDILNCYQFETRLQYKGLLTHTIIDSLEIGDGIGKKFIQFDNQIF